MQIVSDRLVKPRGRDYKFNINKGVTVRRSNLLIVCSSFLLIGICIAGSAGAQTVQQLADRAAIAAQVARYSYAADGKDLDAFTALFTKDAVWKIIPPGTDKPSVDLKSRAAIRKFSRDLYKRNAKIRTGHHQSGLLFTELTATTARTQNMVLLTHQGPDDAAPHVAASGVYYDTWRKTAAGWLFASRTLRMIPLPLPVK